MLNFIITFYHKWVQNQNNIQNNNLIRITDTLLWISNPFKFAKKRKGKKKCYKTACGGTVCPISHRKNQNDKKTAFFGGVELYPIKTFVKLPLPFFMSKNEYKKASPQIKKISKIMENNCRKNASKYINIYLKKNLQIKNDEFFSELVTIVFSNIKMDNIESVKLVTGMLNKNMLIIPKWIRKILPENDISAELRKAFYTKYGKSDALMLLSMLYISAMPLFIPCLCAILELYPIGQLPTSFEKIDKVLHQAWKKEKWKAHPFPAVYTDNNKTLGFVPDLSYKSRIIFLASLKSKNRKCPGQTTALLFLSIFCKELNKLKSDIKCKKIYQSRQLQKSFFVLEKI